MRPDGPRDDYAGPESGPESPFPIKLRGPVIKGFGRGSKELGIPTANIPPEGLSAYPSLSTGIYFGYTSLLHPPSSAPTSSSNGIMTSPTPATPDTSSHTFSSTIDAGEVQIYPCVLSIGYNPFYNNTTRSIEIHILHKFADDFYGSSLNLLMLGFIRPEYDYVSKDSLIKDIMTDCRVAERSLKREGWRIDDGSVADANQSGKSNAQRQGWETWLREFGWTMDMTEGDVKKAEKEVLGQDGSKYES